jgi:hypothetical protein
LSISDKFSTFCTALRMSDTTVSNVRYRANQITKRVNSDFRGIDSDTRYRLFVGSYGRGTDIHVSDIDMIIELPFSVYEKYDKYNGNGQSVLIQAVKESIKKTYSTTHVSGDGQVVKLNFKDGICFEIVPGFINDDGSSYTYPDSNNGGSWKVTKPREEISEITNANNLWNKNLKRLCRMARAWKDTWDVPMGGLLIDTLAYNFLKQWQYKNKDPNKNYWLAPGSSQYVWRKGTFEYKALRCFNIAEEAIQYERDNMPYSANQKWQEIYGNKFP